MRILKKILFLFLMCASRLILAQEIPEAEFSQKPYYITNDKLIEFENAEGIQRVKAKGMGYGGAEISYEVAGIKSTVRLSSSSFRIIVKNENNTDPSESFIVVSSEIKKDARRFRTGSIAGMIKSKNGADNRVKISSKKIRERVFEIVAESPLPPGEYAIIPYLKEANMVAAAGNAPLKMFCFGVD